MRFLPILTVLFLASCAVNQSNTLAYNPKTGAYYSQDTNTLAFGGKGVVKNGEAFAYDNERSFGQAAQAAVALGLSSIQGGVAKARELTRRDEAANVTKRLQEGEVTTRALDANATQVKITELELGAGQ